MIEGVFLKIMFSKQKPYYYTVAVSLCFRWYHRLKVVIIRCVLLVYQLVLLKFWVNFSFEGKTFIRLINIALSFCVAGKVEFLKYYIDGRSTVNNTRQKKDYKTTVTVYTATQMHFGINILKMCNVIFHCLTSKCLVYSKKKETIKISTPSIQYNRFTIPSNSIATCRMFLLIIET